MEAGDFRAEIRNIVGTIDARSLTVLFTFIKAPSALETTGRLILLLLNESSTEWSRLRAIHRGGRLLMRMEQIDLGSITDQALSTVEGSLDDRNLTPDNLRKMASVGPPLIKWVTTVVRARRQG